jgi:hypothetical protein
MNRRSAITATHNTVRLNRVGKGDVAFTIADSTARSKRAVLCVNAARQMEVEIVVLQDAPPGKFSFRLDVISALDPDQQRMEKPPVAVGNQGLRIRRDPFLWWMILAMGAAILIGCGIAWLLVTILRI